MIGTDCTGSCICNPTTIRSCTRWPQANQHWCKTKHHIQSRSREYGDTSNDVSRIIFIIFKISILEWQIEWLWGCFYSYIIARTNCITMRLVQTYFICQLNRQNGLDTIYTNSWSLLQIIICYIKEVHKMYVLLRTVYSTNNESMMNIHKQVK